MLEGLITSDERCIDGWAHLANIAFDAAGPKSASALYERAVAVGERCLPERFGGVLPWDLVDNRPFLRALHGLGLCAWRQGRWDDAEQIFLSRAWLEGTEACGTLACLDAVRRRQPWSRR